MKISFNKNEMTDFLNYIIEKENNSLFSGYAEIDAYFDNYIKATVYDLDFSNTYKFNCRIQEEGSVVVFTNLLCEGIKSITDDEISLTVGSADEDIILKSLNHEVKVKSTNLSSIL